LRRDAHLIQGLAVDEIKDIGERLQRELPVPATNDEFDRLLVRIIEAELLHRERAGH
jgi:hypothetical protein